MRTYHTSIAVFSLVASLLGATPAGAQANGATHFSGTVQLPRLVLPAGSYTFRLTHEGRSVEVTDAARRVVTTLQVSPITRAAAGDVITMRPPVGTAAPEVAAYYAGGGTNGVEFIYPRRAQ